MQVIYSLFKKVKGNEKKKNKKKIKDNEEKQDSKI